MTRVAALDCGTNSLRLLITDLDVVTGHAVEIDRRTTIVRLGQGVDETGRFADEALARTFACIDEYAAVIADASAAKVRFVATSASRDVSNRDEFAAGVQGRLGVDLDVISGDEEAQLSYNGATRGLDGRTDLARPIAVVDIGGGSTEVVSRAGDSGPLRGRSVDIGSVRMTERHLRSDPPTADEIAACEANIATALDEYDLGLADVGTIVGVAGSITTVAAMVLGLPVYDREQVHHAWVDASELMTAVDRLLAMTVAERRALGFMDPGRADVIAGGAMVLRAVVRRTGLDGLLVSEHDILDGIAWSMV